MYMYMYVDGTIEAPTVSGQKKGMPKRDLWSFWTEPIDGKSDVHEHMVEYSIFNSNKSLHNALTNQSKSDTHGHTMEYSLYF